jgi:hypothetical protein
VNGEALNGIPYQVIVGQHDTLGTAGGTEVYTSEAMSSGLVFTGFPGSKSSRLS